ncbi:uncharacterized protein MELLADRAFT_104204 [Melampsora larici-populina 98AG31]|uniref:DUF6589 domain-containing protein n=1 Tax=Melampsora larici-populina (strain 98AG31 / pathotype 3-4-7) TaxID=747676 RepID=F4RDX5_MELLP|nr:uncharacterized protein MELLADRAFT_104204 [Melampsora larici-populina 98AG31]EGG09478.1 hypothetical protein MELLADRAFT_104204 [Melampsora larici-populina 98AG31]
MASTHRIVPSSDDTSTLARTLLDDALVGRRRLMKIGLAFKQTRSIVRNMGKLSRSCEQGRTDWEKLILEEASEIVNAQEVPRGHFPSGAYISSNRITPDYFGQSAESIRETQIKTGMNFLHSLIHGKLAISLNINQPEAEDNDDGGTGPEMLSQQSTESYLQDTEAPADRDTNLDRSLDEETVLSMENLVYVKATPADQAVLKLTKLPIFICAMIAVSCNRRANAIPMANSLMTYAGGVSCRVNEWLHCHGITTSRRSSLSAMDHLRHLQEDRMMDLFKAKCSKDAVSLAAFCDAMSRADRKAVTMSSFCSTPAEAEHWKSVVKCQIATALKEYATYLPGSPDPRLLPQLQTRPPPVDQIEMHQPNIHFLRMMDAPDSSAEGVLRVIDAVIAQIGLDKSEYAQSLLVAGGDVGSNQLLESLRVKRFPPIDSVEANLVHSISQIMGSDKDLHLTQAEDCEHVIDKVWDTYFDAAALEAASSQASDRGVIPFVEHALHTRAATKTPAALQNTLWTHFAISTQPKLDYWPQPVGFPCLRQRSLRRGAC